MVCSRRNSNPPNPKGNQSDKRKLAVPNILIIWYNAYALQVYIIHYSTYTAAEKNNKIVINTVYLIIIN